MCEYSPFRKVKPPECYGNYDEKGGWSGRCRWILECGEKPEPEEGKK